MTHHTGKEESNRHRVYRHIKDAIATQGLRPGDVLHERDLARELGVSRTPVREALQALQNEGWLTVKPRRGSVVNPLNRVEIEEVMQIRLIIASGSIIFAAGRIGPDDFAHLHSLITRQKQALGAGDRAAFMDADMEFHLSLIRLTGNHRLVNITKNLLDSFRRIAIEVLWGNPEIEKSIMEHRAILEALEAGDTLKAQQLMVEHIQKTKNFLQ